MNKNLWIIANWKSNKTISEGLDWLSIAGPKLQRLDNLKIVVCPTFSSLSEIAKEVKVGNFPIMVGSQDLSPFEVGSYTGEEAAPLINQFIQIAILGHSERRKNFSETDELIAQKTAQALKNNIIPLVCVQDAETPVPEGCKLVAYEPIFAIGTGKPDTPEDASAVAGKLKEKHGADLEVLYGGSVTHENSQTFTDVENISGLLIGKASLDPEEFVKIVG